MGTMAEDQPLGFFSRSSRSPSCWCPISRGKPHSDFPWLSLRCEATLAPSFPGPWLPSLQFLKWASHNLLWRLPHLRHPVLVHHHICAKGNHSRIPLALALLTGAKVVRSLSRSSVGSLFNSRLFKPRFITWNVQLPLHLLLAQRPLLPHPVFPH